MTSKLLCICADDFALNPSISQAILDLVSYGSLQAVSCMTQSPFWMSHAPQLKTHQANVEIGLHLNFTEYFNQTEQTEHSPILPLSAVMRQSWLGQLDQAAIKASLQQQWDLFVKAMGRAPDFVDGHQHVHQFPMIRDAITALLAEQNFQGWVRNLTATLPTPRHRFKSWLLPRLGAKQLQRQCQTLDLTQNHYFAGVYNFEHNRRVADYAQLMQTWLAALPENGVTLLMCHPSVQGLSSEIQSDDPIAQARYHEYEYLKSEQFRHDCQRFNVKLTPLQRATV